MVHPNFPTAALHCLLQNFVTSVTRQKRRYYEWPGGGTIKLNVTCLKARPNLTTNYLRIQT